MSDVQPSETLFELVSDSRRRSVVSVLADRDSPVSLSDLAAEVARRERDADRVSQAVTEPVAVTLHHCHLPKLAEAGVVDYDPAEKTIRPVRAEELASLVRGRVTADPDSA